MSVDELEQQLSAAWTRENLAVYADALQAAGDPRGELIAFQLLADVEGYSADLEKRCEVLAKRWLGKLAREPWISWWYGFLEVDDTRLPAGGVNRIFGSPLGRYVRAPWLTRLELQINTARGRPNVSGAVSTQLAERTPRSQS
jgi:hypothetical protein